MHRRFGRMSGLARSTAGGVARRHNQPPRRSRDVGRDSCCGAPHCLTPRLPPAPGAGPAGSRHTPLFTVQAPDVQARISAAGPSLDPAGAARATAGGRRISPYWRVVLLHALRMTLYTFLTLYTPCWTTSG